MSKQQVVVALSTIEAKYMATSHACKEAIQIKRLCYDIVLDVGKITIYCDSQSAICLAKNPTFHVKTKHIDVHYQFVHNMVEDGKVNLEKVTNVVTKPMSTKKFKWCFDSMGLGALSR